jgi:hypothetical protein
MPIGWQVLVVAVASAGFPTLALLYFIGGPNYRDQRAKARTNGN